MLFPMRPTRILAIAAVALSCIAVATPASAHGYRSNVRFGFYFGAPVYPWYYPHAYYPYPYYYQPSPVVVVPAAPTTYIEQQQPQQQPQVQAPAAAPSNYWHFCAESNAYYPYVQQCAGAWQRVSPTPPGR